MEPDMPSRYFWGVWDNCQDGIHVCPCDREGNVLFGHSLDCHCYCKPDMIFDLTMTKAVWNHKELN